VHEGYAWEYRGANRWWWAVRATVRALRYAPDQPRLWKTLLGTLRAAAVGRR
jgi:hypothetical protein